jgi:Dolichyl-phosphate-mannose-protein mannosyltransferase
LRESITYTTVDRRVHLGKRTYFFLIALTLLYAAGACARAAGRPFWYDEVITLIAAKAPDLGTTWKAAVVTDANPPLPHLLTHLAISWFGLNEITARIPAIAGFWLLCLCLFQFVQRRAGSMYGFCALALPVLTGAYYYSTEARAYGLELGFTGIALVAWQAAAEGRKRRLALPALMVSLAAMLMCQYYAVFAYLPLAGGELARARRTRRVDWGVWIAFVLGGTPIMWRAATILGVVKAFSHTWAPAYLRQGVEFWESGLAPLGPYLALLVGVLALFEWRAHAGPVESDLAVPEHEWVAGALFLAIPLSAVIGGLLVTHMFTERYGLIGLVGFCMLTPMLAARAFGRSGTAGVALLAVVLWGMAIRLMDSGAVGNPYQAEPILQAALERGPVVIPDGQLFLQMWQYAPERLKRRLVFLADMASALKYSGFDTIDGGVQALPASAPSLTVAAYPEFAKPGREFVMYQNSLRPGWVLARAVADGAKVEIQQVANYRQLVSVRLPD